MGNVISADHLHSDNLVEPADSTPADRLSKWPIRNGTGLTKSGRYQNG